MISLLTGIGQPRIETWIILTGLLTKSFKILGALTEILVDLLTICQIKGQRAEDLL